MAASSPARARGSNATRRSVHGPSLAVLACCVVWACQDSRAPRQHGAAGAGGIRAESGAGGASGNEAGAGGAEAGTAGVPEGGQGGAGVAGYAGGSDAVAGAGGVSGARGGEGGTAGAAVIEAGGAGGGSEPDLPLAVSGAELVAGPPPDPRNPKLVPPIVELLSESTVMNGARTTLGVRTAYPLEPPRFVVELAGGEGHFVIEGAKTEEPDTYELELHVGRIVSEPVFTVRIAPMDARGNIGAYQNVEYTLVHVGRGDVVVTLAIDQEADLDLSVIEPSGFEISYQIPVSPTGGRLDVDSNAACERDGTDIGSDASAGAGGQGGLATENLERVFWPRDFAPTGAYEVYVKNYDDCGVPPVTFTVTVLNGVSETAYTGRFPAKSIGESTLVAKFEHY